MLNCDRVTTKKRVHGVEAMAESHKASLSQLINWVHNLEHPAVLSTSTGEAGEAKVPATEVRRIAANLEITRTQVATLTGKMHHWETMPQPKLAKVAALELQVRLLMTWLEQSEHEVHALKEEILTRPYGGPPEGMRPDSRVIGELQRKWESWENKYQLLKYWGTPSVNPIGISTPKHEPRVQVFAVPARQERVAESLPGFGSPGRG